MLLSIVINCLGIVIFLFLFWIRSKEDHIANQIFSAAFLILFGILLANIISLTFFPSQLFWLNVAAVFLFLSLSIWRYHLRVFETLEAVVISLLPWLSLSYLKDYIAINSLNSLFASLVITLIIVLFFILDKHYKKFTWYKSGRVGFTGLTILGLFFLTRAAVALTFPDVISFSGKFDIYLSAVIAFTSFLVVFNIARS